MSIRLFEDPGASAVVLLQAKTEENTLEELMDLRGLGATSEEGWSVSVMQDHSKNKLRSKKKVRTEQPCLPLKASEGDSFVQLTCASLFRSWRYPLFCTFLRQFPVSL